MCGICGFISYRKNTEDKSIIEKMASVMNHRGPNDVGFYFQENKYSTLAFAHKRLSILDLSHLGHQPMIFGKWIIVYNGEVYNFKEIRLDLVKLGHNFFSNTDTEVILHAFVEWGLNCVSRFIGMFAFSIYDSENMVLYCCRDRAGVKPFYYYHSDEEFVFGSELKSILKFPNIKKKIDFVALTSYFEFGYIPKDQCIIENAHKLDAACWLIYNLETKDLKIQKYWDIQDYYKLPKLSISYEDAKYQMTELFKSAFKYRLVADVPVGLALSGGYDSTLVASILSKDLGVDLNTFTIGFSEGINETNDALLISKYLNTNHTSYCCTSKDVLDTIPTLQYVFDEPFADNSAIPTILVSKLAKDKVTVLMSADGGDEIFAGYTHYDTCCKTMKVINEMPSFFSHIIYGASKYSSFLMPPRAYRYRNILDRLTNVYMDGKSYKSYSDNIRSYPALFLRRASENLGHFDIKTLYEDLNLDNNDSLDYLLLKDFKFFMKDDVLVKIDRATMSVSIEGREPMLDQRISEFAAQLPLSYKYNNNVKKRIIKDIVHEYVPREIMDKPKRGFSMPISNWLRGPLKDYMMDSLSKDNMTNIGLNYGFVDKLKTDFLNDKLYYHEFIWRLIQYQNWYKTWF